MTWLGPEEKWKEHSRPEARKALDDARDLGWSFRPFSGEAFGRIRCPYPHHDEGGCELRILRTSGPADGSVTANHIRQKLNKCRLLGWDDPTLLEAQLVADLRDLAHLLESAEKLDHADAARARMDQVLGEAEGKGEEPEEAALIVATELEAQVTAAETAALIAAAKFGYTDWWPPKGRGQELASVVQQELDAAVEAYDHEFGDEARALIADIKTRLVTDAD